MCRTRCKIVGLVSVVSLLASSAAAQSRRSPFEAVHDAPELPRVLLIGDSISIGYTLTVRDQLQGVANVHRPKGNCQGTMFGLKQLDTWLGNGKWDVIHFNWGLHDLKYVDSKNNLTDVAKGKQQSDLIQYKKNLGHLVDRLEKTGAKLIFATTTPIPEGSRGRVVGDEDQYNAIAVALMREHQIEVNDLCALVRTMPAADKRKADVHYTASGSRRLGQEVARVITRVLDVAD